MKRFVIGCLALALTSCATTRLYPICFYGEPISRSEFESHIKPQFTEALATTIKQARQSSIAYSPDGRWAMVKTTRSENESIGGYWPRVACLGRADDSASVRQEADCVAYVRNFVLQEDYFSFGNAKDAGNIDIWNEAPQEMGLVNCHRLVEEGSERLDADSIGVELQQQ